MIADLVRYRQQQGNMNVWQTLHRAARVSVQQECWPCMAQQTIGHFEVYGGVKLITI